MDGIVIQLRPAQVPEFCAAFREEGDGVSEELLRPSSPSAPHLHPLNPVPATQRAWEKTQPQQTFDLFPDP